MSGDNTKSGAGVKSGVTPAKLGAAAERLK
jgi:hypothetical protein